MQGMRLKKCIMSRDTAITIYYVRCAMSIIKRFNRNYEVTVTKEYVVF